MSSTTNQTNRHVERPPVVAQPPRNTQSMQVGFKKSFLCSFAGILRLALIVSVCVCDCDFFIFFCFKQMSVDFQRIFTSYHSRS
jgi:hypothetical protein